MTSPNSHEAGGKVLLVLVKTTLTARFQSVLPALPHLVIYSALQLDEQVTSLSSLRGKSR